MVVEASDSHLRQWESNITCLPLRIERDIFEDLNPPRSSFSAVVAWTASGTSAGGSRLGPRGVWRGLSKGVLEATTVRAFGPEMIECPGLFFSRYTSGHVVCDEMGDREN